MNNQRLSGKNFNVFFMGSLIHVETASLAIDDQRAVAYTNGVPNGYVDGPVSASGEIEVDQKNLDILLAAAKKAGSWKGVECFDLMYIAQTSTSRRKIEGFDCMPKISDLINIDSKGGEKSNTKIGFDVTSPDFVKIDGIPYLTLEETVGIY